MSNAPKIGKPQYGNSNFKKSSYVQEGDNYRRVLPPCKSCIEKGTWAVYESIHWGAVDSNGKRKLFKCIQKKDNKTKMIKVRCPACDQIAERKQQKEELKAKYEKQGLSKDEVSGKLEYLTKWEKTFNRDSKWYINALKPDGVIERFAFAHKFKIDLDNHIQNLINPPKGKKPIDPIDAAEGVIFNFLYKKGNQTTRLQKVDIFTEELEVDGETVSRTKRAPLSEAIINRIDEEAWDLNDMFIVLSQDQIQRLVDSEYDPEVVDAVFNSAKVQKAAPADGPDADEPEPDEESAELPKKTETPAETPKVETKTEAPKAEKTETPAPTTKTKALSDGDFFAQFSK